MNTAGMFKDRIPPKVRRKSLRYAVACSMSTTVAVACLMGVPLQLFVIKLGANDFYLGLMTFTIMSGGYLGILGIPSVEKNGKRRTLFKWWNVSLGGYIAIAVLPLLAIFTHSPGGLILGLTIAAIVLRSVGEGFASAGWFPILQDNVPPQITGKFFANLRTYWQSSMLTAMLVIAYLLGKDASFERFAAIFTAGVVSILVRNFCVLFIGEKDSETTKSDQEGIRNKIVETLKNKDSRILLSYIVTYNIAATMTLPFQIRLLKEYGFSDSYILAANSMVNLGAIVSLRFWGKLADKFGNRSVFSISHVGMIVATFLWLLVDSNSFSAVLVFSLYLLWSIFQSGNGIAQIRHIMHTFAGNKQSSIVIVNTLICFSMAIAPLFTGLYLQLVKGMHFQSGVLDLDAYHSIFIISGLLFVIPHLLRKRLRSVKEAPTSVVMAIVTQPLRSIFGGMVRMRKATLVRKHSSKNPQNES